MKLTPFPSLQLRLIALLVTVMTLVWLGAAVATWRDARHELDELLDSHLTQAAALLVLQQTHVSDGDDDDRIEDAPILHRYSPKVAFQVFHEGELVMQSSNVGKTPMSALQTGFDTVTLQRGTESPETWRVYAARGFEADIQVYVGEQTDSRTHIVMAVLRGMLAPLLVALPLLVAGVWWSVRRGLMPLVTLGAQVHSRQPQALEPIEASALPRELQPLVQSLNALFQRIDHMLVSERRFTADAAHELRTPIAAIRAQAQVAMGALEDVTERDHALRATLAGCDRATRLVEQLLTLARLEAPTDNQPHAADLAQVCRTIAGDLAVGALDRDQELELNADRGVRVPVDAVLLAVLIRNLVDNALRYSPDGARVLIKVMHDSTSAICEVHDSGAGLSEGQIQRLGERFFRVLGSEQPGSGLGWSIVRRIAEVARLLHYGGAVWRARWLAGHPALASGSRLKSAVCSNCRPPNTRTPHERSPSLHVRP